MSTRTPDGKPRDSVIFHEVFFVVSGEDAQARADGHGEDHQSQLVDQDMVEEGVDQRLAAGHHDGAAVLRLEP